MSKAAPELYDPRITEQLYHLRHTARVSQQAAAAHFGLRDRNSISAWENGQSQPRTRQRAKFLAYLTDLLHLTRPQLEQVWGAVMVGQWGWEPLTPVELPLPLGLVPLQRPPRVEHYTERDAAELTHLLAELQPGRVVTLCGPGGVGKTSLASAAAWALAPANEPPPRFPDGILFHTFYNQPQATLALEQIARSFGEEPRPTPQAAAQRVLARRRALLILDGAERADDLPTVLAVRGECGVLVTTRRRADAEAIRYDVAPLPLEPAVALLQKWAGFRAADTDIARQICMLVGGLPLAVRLAGQQMAHHEFHANEFLAWLQRTPLQALDLEKRQQASIPLLLQRSQGQLSPEACEALAAVGVLALSPFDLDVVAAALALPTPSVAWVLGDLVNQSWLSRSTGRYQVVHPLIHAFAQERLAAAPFLLERIMVHYHALVEKQSQRGSAGFAVLDGERPHLLALLQRCAAAGQWALTQQLAAALDHYLNLQGHWSDRLVANRQGLEAARRLDDRAAEIVALRNLANAHQQFCEYTQAITLYTEGLSISRALADRTLEGDLLHHLGNTYLQMDQYAEAEQQFVASRQIRRTYGDRQGEAHTLLSLGMVYRQWGRWEEASQLYTTSLQILRELSDRQGEYTALNRLGIIHLLRGQWPEALAACTAYLALARELGNRQTEANTLAHLGLIYARLGRAEESLQYATASLDLARLIESRSEEVLALNNLGAVYYILGQWQEAEQTHKVSLQQKLVLGDRLGTGHSYLHLGRVYRCQGRLDEAIAQFEASLGVLRALRNPQGEGMALGELGMVYQQQQRYDLAIATWRTALTKLHPDSPEHREVIRWLAAALATE